MPQHRKSKVQIKSKGHTKSKSRKHSKKSMRGGFLSKHTMPTITHAMPSHSNAVPTGVHDDHSKPSMNAHR